MGENIYETTDLVVTHYAGPAIEGIDRARWQVTPTRRGIAVLRRDEVWDLIEALLRDLRR